MAVCLINKSGGGITSDDVTAKREHVVKGYATITVDSNDEIVEGLIEDRGEGAVVAFAIGREDWNHQIWATFRNGWYHRAPHPEGHESYIYIKYEALANLLGVDPAKMLQTLNVADRQGQIKVIDTGLDDFKANKQNSSYGIDVNRRTFYIDFPHGSAYYTRGDGHPHACIDADKLGNAGSDSLLEGMSATSEKGVKFWGIIKRWICTTGDVLSCANHECFVYDDQYAGRGRGIAGRMLNSHYIQGANWIFIPSPNLYPQNIRAGVNINGVVGTMPDYSTGRVVFNGATFDGTILLGVANKDFYVGRDYYALDLDGKYKYSGIYNGGINLLLSTTMPSIKGRYIGCIMSQSVNLTPFNRIDVYWRVVGDVKNDASIDFIAGITKASALRRGGIVIVSRPIDGFNEESVKGMAKSPHITKSGKIELYVGGINEQAFLYFCASANISNNRDVFTGAIQITRIDFLN